MKYVRFPMGYSNSSSNIPRLETRCAEPAKGAQNGDKAHLACKILLKIQDERGSATIGLALALGAIFMLAAIMVGVSAARELSHAQSVSDLVAVQTADTALGLVLVPAEFGAETPCDLAKKLSELNGVSLNNCYETEQGMVVEISSQTRLGTVHAKSHAGLP